MGYTKSSNYIDDEAVQKRLSRTHERTPKWNESIVPHIVATTRRLCCECANGRVHGYVDSELYLPVHAFENKNAYTEYRMSCHMCSVVGPNTYWALGLAIYPDMSADTSDDIDLGLSMRMCETACTEDMSNMGT